MTGELDHLNGGMHEKQRIVEDLERRIQSYTVGPRTLVTIGENRSNTSQRRKRDLELKLHRAEDNVDDFKSRIEEAAQDSKLNTLQARLKVTTYLSFQQIMYAHFFPRLIKRRCVSHQLHTRNLSFQETS